MPKRSSRNKFHQEDSNQNAFRVVQQATGQPVEFGGKDPLAVILGRRGGLRGGDARAKKLSPERRSEIARRAVQARWSKKRNKKV